MATLRHLENVLLLCVKLISHDPNYNDDDQNSTFNPINEESMDTTTGDDDDDLQNDEEEQEEDEYSDDDDMSWKVSIKHLSIFTRHAKDICNCNSINIQILT